MRTEQIVRNVDGATVVKGSLPKGHLNGLLISLNLKSNGSHHKEHSELDTIVNSKIRAKFVHDKVEHLVTNLPLSAFIALSDIDNGSTANLSRILNTGMYIKGLEDPQNKVHISEDLAQPENAVKTPTSHSITKDAIVLYLDFGSIYCENGNEFEFELEGMTNHMVSAYTVSKETEPFHFIKYDIDFDLNENHQNIMRALIFTETVDKDATVYTESQSMQYSTDLEGLRAATQMFGQIENVGVGILLEVFRAIHGVPEDVWIKITRNAGVPLQRAGSQLGILTVRVDFPLDLTTSKNIDLMKEQIELVRRFEVDHKDQAIAMVASGLMTPSVELEEQIKNLV